MCPFERAHLYPLDKSLLVQLLGRRVFLFFAFWGTSILFSRVAALACIPSKRTILNCTVQLHFIFFFDVYPEIEDSRDLRNDSLKTWIQSSISKVQCFRIFPDWHWTLCNHLLLFIMEGSSLWGPSWLKYVLFFFFK